MKATIHPNDQVNVATFNTLSDAEALKSLLEREGIPAEVQDETRLQRYWFLVGAKAGFHVLVPKGRQAEAEAFLARRETALYLRDAVRCPSCGLYRVQYPAVTRKNMLPALVSRLLTLLHITHEKYYCENCHFTWTAAPVQASASPAARTTSSI